MCLVFLLVFLLQDAAGSVKLWDITRGVVVEDYGKVSMEPKTSF